jgi:histidinol-phosphate aminotransferase
LPLRPRPEIENLEACPHGGPNYAELERMGFAPEDVLDFSVSANPFGPPPGVIESFKTVAVDRYPDSDSAKLRRALADKLQINTNNIIVGNGSMELIRIVASAYIDREDTAVIVEPTFGEYEIACQIAGAKIVKFKLREDDDFNLNVDDFSEFVRDNRPKAIFLCNPNNPTGQYLDRSTIEQILSVCQDSLLVLDEAYISFTENPWRALDLVNRNNLVILRSMTKDYALAGLRLGYAVASPEIVDTLRKVCSPWNVNAVAQCAGVEAIQDSGYLRQCQNDIRKAGDFLKAELTQLGLKPLPSQAHFFLIKVGDAAKFRQALLRYGIMVRDCTSFGLPEYTRIAPRSVPECEILIGAIRKIRE